MKKTSGFVFLIIIISIFLLTGFALYLFPKNYELLEIDAKNENYAAAGLLTGWIAFAISIIGFIVFREKRRRIIFGLEFIGSILLLLLWNRY